MTAGARVGVVADAPRAEDRRSLARLFISASFAMYLGLLIWLVLFKLQMPYVGEPAERAIKLVPFIATADAGSNAPYELFANLVIFVPCGFLLGLLVPRWPWFAAAVVTTFALAAISLGLEVGQYVLAVGKSDVTDVLVNTAGGLIGLVAVAVVRFEERATRQSCE